MASVLIVTWDAALGGTAPALGLARLLAARAHDVRVVGPQNLSRRVEAVGGRLCVYPEAAEYVAQEGLVMDEQTAYAEEIFFGEILPTALREELDRERADVLVVDAFLATTVCAAQASGVPVAGLVHTLGRFHPQFGPWGSERTNAYRNQLGLDPIETTSTSVMTAVLRGCDVELVTLPAELDVRPDPAPNLVHVGPIAEGGMPEPAPELPWPESDTRPLIVVGLSTAYMRQEVLLERILDALAVLPVRVLATTGPELDERRVRVPTGVELRRFISHAAVLPKASLVVTHGGTGTLMAAFAAGLPCVCIPLGRDQLVNATTVAELGLGLALERDASVDQIRDATQRALASAKLREAASRLALDIASYGGGSLAVDTLESLAAESRPSKTTLRA